MAATAALTQVHDILYLTIIYQFNEIEKRKHFNEAQSSMSHKNTPSLLQIFAHLITLYIFFMSYSMNLLRSHFHHGNCSINNHQMPIHNAIRDRNVNSIRFAIYLIFLLIIIMILRFTLSHSIHSFVHQMRLLSTFASAKLSHVRTS